MVLVNATKRTVVADQCRFANSVLKRMVGLLNRRSMNEGDGLLLDRCYGIHTFGMRFAIDVLFLDKDLRVMRSIEALPPFRTCVVRQAVYVLELPTGAIRRSRTGKDDQIQIRATAHETATVPIPSAEKSPA